jgi:hypothetical protein
VSDRPVVIPAPPDPEKIPVTDLPVIPIVTSKGFSFPIPGLDKTFVIPPLIPSIGRWDAGPNPISREKREKARAAKKLKKLRRKQGR